MKAIDVSDALEAAGGACIVYGVSQWSVPAAWVLAGVLLVAVAVLLEVQKARALPGRRRTA